MSRPLFVSCDAGVTIEAGAVTGRGPATCAGLRQVCRGCDGPSGDWSPVAPLPLTEVRT